MKTEEHGEAESQQLFAVIVEASDDGGTSWEIHNIAWTVGEAAMLAREIPWEWRLRKVALSDAGLIGSEETKSALATMEKLAHIFQVSATRQFSCQDAATSQTQGSTSDL